ncbi:gamma-glutamylcyclotransferase family protein [Flavobacterium sp.]|uniref:gamma-glutamylcyclotransferase family protein n=1 Tax=Flavobacterium sp. TaxID=239 RepID=UPI002B4B2C12|nr:gamma-glutamylcyclotransferase family protein [Flavobacterium sp.]HLP64746.1 gamma-glutamylcyclotransferase family protein [Flavobacterium sp.]
MSTYIFGYGSLVNLESLEKTIKRKLKPNEIHPVTLNGYTRVWNYTAKIFAAELNKEITAVYLNIAPFHNSSLNGIVFEVSDSELELLKKRELFYSLVDITANVKFDGNVKVFTFICYDKQHLTDYDTKCFVMKKYIDIVNSGFESISENFLTEYNKTTQPQPYKVISGDYTFVSS